MNTASGHGNAGHLRDAPRVLQILQHHYADQNRHFRAIFLHILQRCEIERWLGHNIVGAGVYFASESGNISTLMANVSSIILREKEQRAHRGVLFSRRCFRSYAINL